MILYNKRGMAMAKACGTSRTEPIVGKGATKKNIVLKAQASVKKGR